MSFGLIVAVVVPAVMVGVVLRKLLASDLTPDSQLGPALFSDDVRVQVRRSRALSPRYVPLKTVSGWLRLTVHGHVIAIRCLGIPRPVAVVMGLERTFDAPSFSIGVSKVSEVLSIPGVGVDRVVLHGKDRRGIGFDVALKPRTSSIADLMEALTKAGATRS